MARYTDDYRASAVVMLRSEGYPEQKGALTRISRYLKVPHSTLLRWYHAKSNPPPSEIVQIKKEQIIELLLGEAYGALKEMKDARLDADYRELATAAAILIDKWQLLEGKPTERHDHTHTVEERANRIAVLLDAARERRTGQPPRSTDD